MITGWMLITTSKSITELQIYFAVVGLGASAFHPPGMAIISEMFEKDKGKALSINMAVGMGGTAISPFLLGQVSRIFTSWQGTASAYAVAALTFGIALLVVGMFSGMFKRVSWSEDTRKVSESTGSLNVAFLLSPLIFVPLLFTSIRSSFFRTSSVFTALIYEDYVNLSKVNSTIATALVMGVASMFTMVGGVLSDRFTPRTAIVASSIGSFAGAFGLVFLADLTDLVSFSFFFFVLNAFYYVGSPASTALLANRVSPSQRGKLFGAFFSVGQILSLATPVVFGYVKDNFGIVSAFIFILVLASIAMVLGIYIFVEERVRESKII